MFKRIMAFIAVVALAITGLTVTASAQDDVNPDRTHTISGRGSLAATGEGTVDIEMGGSLRMHLIGDVTIEDLAGDMEFHIRTAPESDGAEALTPESGTTVTLTDFDGRFIVRGTRFTVHAEGKLKLLAHGHGVAYLNGTGRFRTWNHSWIPWVTGGVDFGPVEPA